MRKGNSWIIAFDKDNGEVSWEVERNYDTPPECDHSYATPIVTEENGKEVVLVWEQNVSHPTLLRMARFFGVVRVSIPRTRRTGWLWVPT